jgi:hypothetical protein
MGSRPSVLKRYDGQYVISFHGKFNNPENVPLVHPTRQLAREAADRILRHNNGRQATVTKRGDGVYDITFHVPVKAPKPGPFRTRGEARRAATDLLNKEIRELNEQDKRKWDAAGTDKARIAMGFYVETRTTYEDGTVTTEIKAVRPTARPALSRSQVAGLNLAESLAGLLGGILSLAVIVIVLLLIEIVYSYGSNAHWW